MSAVQERRSFPGIRLIEEGRNTEVDLSGCGVGQEGAQRIAAALRKNVILVSLNLADNPIDDSCGQLLVSALKVNYSLQAFISEGTKIGKQTQNALQQLVYRNRALRDRKLELVALDKKGDVEKALHKLEAIQREFSIDPFGLSAVFGLERTLEFLAVCGENVQFDGWSPLHLATYRGDLSTVKRLLKENADICAKTPEGYTAYELLRKTQESITDPSKVDKYEEMENILRSHANALLRVTENAPIEEYLPAGATLRDFEEGQQEVGKKLLGEKLLVVAEQDEPTEILIRYIEGGADVNSKKQDGMTSLHLIAKGGNLHSIQVLLLSGASVNAQDSRGNTPTHIAVIERQGAAIPVLVAHGADLAIRNKEDQTPITLGKESSREVQACFSEMELMKEKFEKELAAFGKKVSDLEEITYSGLKKKIDGLINRDPFSPFYRIFYTKFSSKLTNEICGLKSSLSRFAASKPTGVSSALDSVSDFGQLIPIPFAPLVVYGITDVAQRALGNTQKKTFGKLAEYVADADRMDLFIKTLSHDLLILLGDQLPILDKFNPDKRQVEVDEQAMKILVKNLISRLFAFMLTDQFLEAPDPEKIELLTQSLGHFNPSVFFKLSYAESLPGIGRVVISLPNLKKIMNSTKKEPRLKALVKKGGTKEKLTVEGFLQQAPLKVGSAYYQPHKCQPEHYPPLILATPLPKELKSRCVTVKNIPARETLSYREFISHWERIKTNRQSEGYTRIRKEIEKMGYAEMDPQLASASSSGPSGAKTPELIPEEADEKIQRLEKQIQTLEKTLKTVLKRLDRLEKR